MFLCGNFDHYDVMSSTMSW